MLCGITEIFPRLSQCTFRDFFEHYAFIGCKKVKLHTAAMGN